MFWLILGVIIFSSSAMFLYFDGCAEVWQKVLAFIFLIFGFGCILYTTGIFQQTVDYFKDISLAEFLSDVFRPIYLDEPVVLMRC